MLFLKRSANSFTKHDIRVSLLAGTQRCINVSALYGKFSFPRTIKVTNVPLSTVNENKSRKYRQPPLSAPPCFAFTVVPYIFNVPQYNCFPFAHKRFSPTIRFETERRGRRFSMRSVPS